ncbi:MAG: hypothetical protein WBJ37_04685 [Bacteroidales bacterium]
MRSLNIVFSLFLLFPLISSPAQPVIIKGNGEGYAGAKLAFYRQSDPVSRKLIPLFIAECNEKGEFQTEIPVKSSELVYIKSGVYRFLLLVREGHTYELKLPAYNPMPPEEENNPFFAGITVIPEVVNNPGDINNLIRTFDAEYNTVFNRVSERVDKDVRKDEIPGLIESLNKLTGYSDDPFFRDFVKYRTIMLNLVAWGEYPGRREDSVLINQKFVPENPAYTDLLEQLYENSFKLLSAGQLKKEFAGAVNSSSPSEIMKILTREGKVVNPLLQQYVILMNTYYGYFSGLLKEENALAIFDSLRTGGKSEYICNLALILKQHATALAPGTFPPPFSLPDSSGRMVTAGDFRGKFLLLVFIKETDYASLSELALLKSWIINFKDNITLAAVITGKNYIDMLSYFRKRGYDWLFLDGTVNPFLADLYDLRIYPSFMLLDREGRIAVRYCPPPSENLEGFLKSILDKESRKIVSR